MVDESIAQALQVAREYPVLYVDDDVENLEVFEAQFEEEFCVLCAASGRQALELMEHNKVSILVSDQRMPAMPGVELCELSAAVSPVCCGSWSPPTPATRRSSRPSTGAE